MATDLPIVIDETRQQDDAAFVKMLQDGVKKRVSIASEPKPLPFDVLVERVTACEARLAALEKGTD